MSPLPITQRSEMQTSPSKTSPSANTDVTDWLDKVIASGSTDVAAALRPKANTFRGQLQSLQGTFYPSILSVLRDVLLDVCNIVEPAPWIRAALFKRDAPNLSKEHARPLRPSCETDRIIAESIRTGDQKLLIERLCGECRNLLLTAYCQRL